MSYHQCSRPTVRMQPSSTTAFVVVRLEDGCGAASAALSQIAFCPVIDFRSPMKGLRNAPATVFLPPFFILMVRFRLHNNPVWKRHETVHNDSGSRHLKFYLFDFERAVSIFLFVAC
jgi:hypothetical protein